MEEHAVLASVWLLLDSADRGNRVPATDLPEQVASGAGDALGAAREAGGKGWEALKRKLGAAISGGTADSGPK